MALDPQKLIHCFDPDGESVLIRRQLQTENAMLKQRVVLLERMVKALKRRMEATGTADLQQPTRH